MSTSEISTIGKAYAPLFAAFAAKTLSEARAAKIREAWFFTREGYFFSAVFRAFQSGLGGQEIEGKVLHVSRLATFAASLQGTEPLSRALGRLWSQYDQQTVKDLLLSLGIDPKTFTAQQTAPVPLDMPARSLDLSQPAWEAALTAHITEKRGQLEEYLRGRGFPVDGEAVVVDIGWRGTIQDNLAHVLPQLRTTGVYLGLLPRLNEQPSNVRKTAWVGDLGIQDTPELRKRLSFALPFEFLTHGPGGSTVGYRGGEPVFKPAEQEDEAFLAFTQHVQQEIVWEVAHIAMDLRAGRLDYEGLERAALAAWDNIVQNPQPLLVSALLSHSHCETFGVGATLRYGSGVTWSLLAKALVSRIARTRLRMETAGLPWKHKLRRHPAITPALRFWLRLEPVVCRLYKVLHPRRRWRQCS